MKLPKWISKHIRKLECPGCSKHLDPNVVRTIGIREYKDREPETFLFIEYTCKYCKKNYGFDIAICNLKNFVFDMVDQYKGKNTQIDDIEELERRIKENSKDDDGCSDMDRFVLQVMDDAKWREIGKKYIKNKKKQ